MELFIHLFFPAPSFLLKDSSLKILAKQTQAVADNRAHVARCSSGAFPSVSSSPAPVTAGVDGDRHQYRLPGTQGELCAVPLPSHATHPQDDLLQPC